MAGHAVHLMRLRALLDSGRRVLLGIAGAPGSGKSTLAQQLHDSFRPQVQVVPMDGFHLAHLLHGVDGFVSVERFRSLADPRKLLSLSFWRDEDALARWRNTEAHRRAQALGRGTVFEDYRLRIAVVSRDYGMNDRAQAPDDSRAAHGA